jgi:hypothetical protein
MMSVRLPATLAVLICGVSHQGCHAQADAQAWMPVRDTQTITRTLRFDGSAERTLDVRTIHGTILVTAADVSDVQLDARRIVRAQSEADVQTAEREVTVDFLDGASRVGAVVRDRGDVCGEPFSRSGRPRYVVTFEFTVRVPRLTNLRLCTINGGEIRVEGTDGDFEINNINGRITIENVRGGGSAETINGALTVSFTEPPRAASLFKTLNGDVEATFPADLSADLTLRTRHGELLTDFDVQPLPQRSEKTERSNGQFVYRSDGSARVRVGRGGPELTLETFNGDVRVLRAAR